MRFSALATTSLLAGSASAFCPSVGGCGQRLRTSTPQAGVFDQAVQQTQGRNLVPRNEDQMQQRQRNSLRQQPPSHIQDQDWSRRFAGQPSAKAVYGSSPAGMTATPQYNQAPTRDPSPNAAQPQFYQDQGYYQQPPPQQQGYYREPPPPQQAQGLSVDDLAIVLQEFVASPYARDICNYCNVGPTDYGSIHGMFESVRLDNDKLTIKFKSAFHQRADKLMDKLAKHLRQRTPTLRFLCEDNRQRGFSTKIL